MPIPRILLVLIVMLSLSSCYNSSVMFRADKSYSFEEITLPDTANIRYRIAPNDVLNMKLYSNDGFKLIDLSTMSNDGAQQNQRLLTSGLNYTVERDGRVKLPILGRIPITGYTLKEAELMLEEMYQEFYNNPFIILSVNDRRVVVFPGGRGDAKVINIDDHTTLIEGIAMAGGIAENGKAKAIRLIRRPNLTEEPIVYNLDMATMEGLEYSNIILQANDIIYIAPKMGVARELVRDLGTYFGIISTAILLYSLANQRL